MISYSNRLLLPALLLLGLISRGEATEYELTPSYSEAVITKPNFFQDSSGHEAVAFGLEFSDKPNAIGLLLNRNGSWSPPLLLPAEPLNDVHLDGAVNLAGGTPMLLVHGNDMDYAKLLHIPPDAAIEDYIEQIKPYAVRGTRLFSRVEVNGQWSRPIPIPDSYGAQSARITAGMHGSAAALFLRDADQNTQTADDIALRIALYRNHAWQQPFTVADTKGGVALAPQIAAVDEGYLITWVTRATANAWTLHSATVSVSTGSVVSSAQSIFTNLPTVETPLLASRNGSAHLFWLTRGEENQLRLYRADYDGHWSQAKRLLEHFDAKLSTSAFSSLAGQQDALVYLTGSQLNAGLVDANGWRVSVPVGSVSKGGELGAMDYKATADQLLVLATIKATPAGGGTPPEYELKLLSFPIEQDLAVTLKQKSPVVELGSKGELIASVRNIGLKRSEKFSIAAESGGSSIQNISGDPLDIGESRDFSFSVPVSAAEVSVNAKIDTPVAADPEANNFASTIVRIRPDYAVEKVKRIDGGHLLIQLQEKTGISAPTVPVHLYLEQSGKPERIASTQFDPNNAGPLVLETSMLAGKTDRYKVIVKINEDHAVSESDYGNNQRAYVFEPLPDYSVDRVSIDGDNRITVTIRNSGVPIAESVSVLVTADAELAASPGSGLNGGVYHNVTLHDGVATFDMPLDELPQANAASTVFVVVNPLGQILEADRNNNLRRINVAEAERAGVVKDSAPLTPMSISASSWCDNVEVAVSNPGDQIVISPTVQLTLSGAIIAKRTLPAVLAGDQESFSLTGLGAGEYDVELQYAIGDRSLSATTSVSVQTPSYCAGAADNNVQLISAELILPTKTDEKANLRLALNVTGFTTEYRKPLIRLPLRIRVTQGTQTYFEQELVRYMPVLDGNQELVVEIPADHLPSGPYTVTAEVMPRNDEPIGGDNLQTVRMAGGE